ncbi:MAG: hypothetical protein R3B95_07860 [Nitrospirales bacterium]|nr:hypothetical protein [Nitrospirales bacterium]
MNVETGHDRGFGDGIRLGFFRQTLRKGFALFAQIVQMFIDERRLDRLHQTPTLDHLEKPTLIRPFQPQSLSQNSWVSTIEIRATNGSQNRACLDTAPGSSSPLPSFLPSPSTIAAATPYTIHETSSASNHMCHH